MRNDRERLQDILEAVEKITQRVGSDKETFEVEHDLAPLKGSVEAILTAIDVD